MKSAGASIGTARCLAEHTLCVCVCVCVWERERETGGLAEG
jgi:hypothetical protein